MDTEFQWPPFLDQAVNDWDETVGKSFADKGDAGAALDQWQQRITTYAKNQGFKVSAVSPGPLPGAIPGADHPARAVLHPFQESS